MRKILWGLAALLLLPLAAAQAAAASLPFTPPALLQRVNSAIAAANARGLHFGVLSAQSDGSLVSALQGPSGDLGVILVVLPARTGAIQAASVVSHQQSASEQPMTLYAMMGQMALIHALDPALIGPQASRLLFGLAQQIQAPGRSAGRTQADGVRYDLRFLAQTQSLVFTARPQPAAK